MATYQIQINERKLAGKGLLALMKASPEIVTSITPARKSRLYKSLESGFRDVREILDGKQKEVTLDEFLNEL
ncbi:MAG: hypothetical protein LBT76_05665 [Tannerella sp.]|jgi:hypothetical protein|nr:hypothetical protein [Tannerella sp.]